MTACLYANPFIEEPEGRRRTASVFIADTMASSEAPLPRLVPATRTRRNSLDRSSVQLVRKLYILNGHTVVAFSGSEPEILKCLDQIAGALPALRHDEDPMSGVANIANCYPSVRMIGATLYDGGGLRGLVSPDEDRFNLPFLGMCAAIGSGKATWRALTEEYTALLQHRPLLHPGRLAATLAQSLCIETLGREIAGRLRSWGACVEWAHVEEGMRWIYGPSTLYLFWETHLSTNDPPRFKRSPRWLAYDPGLVDGRILSAVHDGPGTFLQESLIVDRFDQSPRDDLHKGWDYWSRWTPKIAIATAIIHVPGHGLDFISESFGGKDAICTLRPDRVATGLAEAAFAQFTHTVRTNF